MRIDSHNIIQVFIEVVPQFKFHERKGGNVHSSSINPNSCTTTIFANLKNLGKECYKMWEASKVCQNQVKGLTWNGASIAATLYYIVILKILDYMSRTFIDKIVGQMLVVAKL